MTFKNFGLKVGLDFEGPFSSMVCEALQEFSKQFLPVGDIIWWPAVVPA